MLPLEGIGAVVLDEFHERSIEGDLALAFCLEVQQALRPDLALLVMSATLDGSRVTALLGEPTVHHSEGRTYPVRTVHRLSPAGARVGAVVAAAVRQVLDEGEGDVLAFLPGQREIGDAQRCAGRGAGIEVVPLYGALPRSAQRAALRRWRASSGGAGHRHRRVQPDRAGVRIVVDSGWARRPAFDPATGMSRLRTVRVSRASADQRRGRAAREGPGLCVRLWAEHEALEAHAPPSIAEEDLAPTALEVAAWGTPVGRPGAAGPAAPVVLGGGDGAADRAGGAGRGRTADGPRACHGRPARASAAGPHGAARSCHPEGPGV